MSSRPSPRLPLGSRNCGIHRVNQMKQRTLAREATISGSALHTGEAVTLTLKPAAPDTGIVFRRIDLNGKPEIKPRIEQVGDLVRATTIQDGHTKIHTIEHVL